VEGVLLNLQDGSTSQQGRLTFSDRHGDFTFEGVAGESVLSASHSDYAPVTLQVDMTGASGAQEVEIALEEAARTIRGRVLDNRDFPVSGAEVVARSVTSGSPLVRHSFSEDDGTFEVDGMAGGQVVVQARAAGMSQGSAVAGPDVDEVTLWLEQAGALVVDVVDPDTGDAVEGCTVEVLGIVGRRRRQACEMGTATIVDVPAGRASLWVRAPGRATQVLETVVSAGADPTDPDASLRVEMPAATTVHGQVLDADGEPVVGARVSLSPLPRTYTPATRGAWVESGAQGMFELEGLAIDQQAVVYADHASLGSGSVEVGPAWPDEEPTVEIWLEGPAGGRSRGRHFGVAADLTNSQGQVAVAWVAPGSRAESAGLRVDDRLVSIDGRGLSTMAEAYRALRGPRGSALTMTISRGDDREVVLLIERELVLR